MRGNAILRLVLVLAAIGAMSVAVQAAIIDFEVYADGQNLNGVNLGGVTLTSPTNVVEVYEDRFGVGYHSPTKAIASTSGCVSVNPIVGVFDAPQTFVRLWGGDVGGGDDTDSWQLEAFDAAVGGNSLGVANSGSWGGGPYRSLEISAPNIWRFEARWTGPVCGVGYDDLEFIPEPVTLSLLALGGLAVVRRRRRT